MCFFDEFDKKNVKIEKMYLLQKNMFEKMSECSVYEGPGGFKELRTKKIVMTQQELIKAQQSVAKNTEKY